MDKAYWIAGTAALLVLAFVVWLGTPARKRTTAVALQPQCARDKPVHSTGAVRRPRKWKNPFVRRKKPVPHRLRFGRRGSGHSSGYGRPIYPPMAEDRILEYMWDPNRSRYEQVAQWIQENFSYEDAVKFCRFERGLRFPRYARELIRIMQSRCRETKGTPAWPEAVLNKGLCYELNGEFGHVEGFGETSVDLRAMYRKAADECPDTTTPVARQLLLRAGLCSFLAEYFRYFHYSNGDVPPYVFLNEAADSLSILAVQDLSGVKTPAGGEMQPLVNLVSHVATSRTRNHRPTFLEVRALIEASGEILPPSSFFTYTSKCVARQLMQWIDGPFADDYNAFLLDPSISDAEKARVTRPLDRAYGRFDMKRPDPRQP